MLILFKISVFLFLCLAQNANATEKIREEFLKKIKTLKGACLQSTCKSYLPKTSLCEVFQQKAPEAKVKKAVQEVFKSFTQCQKKFKICGQCYRNMVLSKTVTGPAKAISFNNVTISHVGTIHFLDKGRFQCIFYPNSIQLTFTILFPKITIRGNLSLSVKDGFFVNDSTADKITINKSKVKLTNLRLTVQAAIAITPLDKCENYNITNFILHSCPSNGIKIVIPKAPPIKNMEEVMTEITNLFEKKPYREEYRKCFGELIKRIIGAFIDPCKPCSEV